MKRISILIVLAALFFSACNHTYYDRSLNEIIEENIQQHETVHYKVLEKIHHSNGVDTTVTPFEVWAVRDNSDSLRNGHVLINNYYRPYNIIYRQGDMILVIPPKKVNITYPKFTEELISQADWLDIFLQPKKFMKLTVNTKNKVNITEQNYQAKKCYQIDIELVSEQQEDKKSFSYIIDKENNFPLYSKYVKTGKEDTYTEELYFSDIEFDNTKLTELKKTEEKLLKENPIAQNNAYEEDARLKAMLHIGDDAPLFKGKYYQKEDSMNLADYMGKNVVIIDFWYTHCPPCVKAMPAISDLAKKYADKGLKVFGVNSVDNSEKGMTYLNKFLSKRQLSYPVVLIPTEVDNKYKIVGYPTLYIIGKDGKIAYAEIGYNEDKFEGLKKKVEELMK